MFYKFFCFMFFVLLAFSTVFVHNGYTHERYLDSELGGSTYADVKGSITAKNMLYPDEGKVIHIHGFVYSWEGEEGHRVGDYTIVLQVSMPPNVFDDDWWKPEYDSKTPVLLEEDFFHGARMEGDISFDAPDLSDVRGVEYKGSATVRNQLGTYRDTINKPVTKFNEEEGLGPTWSQTVNNCVTPPTLGISPADPNQTPQPGDSATLTLVTEEAYDYVNWHVKAPWETSERGTCVECDWAMEQ